MPHQPKPLIPRSISQSALAKKDRLKEELDKDLKKPNDDAKVHHLERFSVFTFRLPSMRGRSQEFMRYFLNHVLDNNIEYDLHDAKVINWWTPFLKKLFPLSTVGDGNCLLHAVSQAMWGCHDHSHFLRRLMYVVLAGDAPEEFRIRWQREQKYQDECESRLEITMTSLQWQNQWEEILKTAEDKRQTANVNTSALECLEGIHIFVLVNILRRPIIVLGETVLKDFGGQPIGYNHLSGVYLPLLWKSADCVRTPIVLAYHCNHFVPMLSIMDPPDVAAATDTGKHGVPLVSHDMEQLPLHFLREEEERTSANLLTLYLDVFESNIMVKGDSVPVLYAKFHFHDIDRELNMLDEYMESMNHAFIVRQGAHQTNIVQSLVDYEAPETAPLEPSAPSPSLLSNISEMSIHTVPQTGPVDPQPTQPPQTTQPLVSATENQFFPPTRTPSYPPPPTANQTVTPYPTRPSGVATYPPTSRRAEYRDVSISGEECRQPNCSFYSSLETYPYCHDCYAKLQKMQRSQALPGIWEGDEPGNQQRESRPISRSSFSTGANDEVFGSQSFTTPERFDRQRSLSYEEEEQNDLPHRNDDDQPLSIPYVVNRITCLHPECPKRGKEICEGRCHEHYRNIGSQELRDIHSGQTRPRSRSHLDHLSPARRSEGHEALNQNTTTTEARIGSEGSGAGARGRSECHGNRTGENTNMQRPAAAATYPPQTPPVVGTSVGRIPGNLVEPTSIRPVRPCRNRSCTRPGYEYTEGFCQTCFNAISMAKAQMAQSPRQEKISLPARPRLPCRTPNCVIYAEPDMAGYCHICFHRLFDRDLPSSLTSTASEPARLNPQPNPEFAAGEMKAAKCLVPGCDRYGDPAYQGFCKRCLDLQKQTQLTGLGVNNTQAAPRMPSNPPAAAAETHVKAVHNGYKTTNEEIEKACKKATGKCKKLGCPNYGNMSCRGYCNRCFQSMH